MSKKVISALLSLVLLFGAALTVNAGVKQQAPRSVAERYWSVSSYTGNDSSSVAYDVAGDCKKIYVFTSNYSSEPVGGQLVWASSPQSPDQLGINSTQVRTMGYYSNILRGDPVRVNFYAYSSTDRIVADGYINAD